MVHALLLGEDVEAEQTGELHATSLAARYLLLSILDIHIPP